MSDIAIRVERLSKQFRIGSLRKNRNLREALIDGFKAPFRRAGRLLQGQATRAGELNKTIWALKDVSLEIKHGEIVGIIGRNGAGKSTLLKIICRITEPTIGFAEMHGRVGSLLEVGTGFHSELSGRENIYLNGAILGMRRGEIRGKFDEIVAFSGIEQFIDTPVKHYSSGMYMRLAFAVAAHLEPDILVVDEVLAVGDAQFQKKCLKKMEGVGREGRTVLFVSHNMQAIARLCRRAILLEDGSVALDGPVHQAVSSYVLEGRRTTALREWGNSQETPGGDVARLRAVRVKARNGEIAEMIDIGQPVFIEISYEVIKPGYVLLPHFELVNEEGVVLFTALDSDPDWRKCRRPVGSFVSRAQIPGNLLQAGQHFIRVGMITLDPRITQFYELDAVSFQVTESGEGGPARGDFAGHINGVLRPLLNWSTVFNGSEQPGRD